MAQIYNGYGYNPYQQYAQPQYQMPVQNISSGIPGRIIDDIAQVGANEVPMDGSKAVFMKSDGSILYVKQWQPNGTISTNTYKPYFDTKTQVDEQVTTEELKLSFDTLKTKLDNIEEILNKMFSPKKSTTKKEGADE